MDSAETFQKFIGIDISCYYRKSYENEKCQNPIVLRVSQKGINKINEFLEAVCNSKWSYKLYL